MVLLARAFPVGAFAVACSGGADSVALLLLACEVPGVRAHVVHLNHQTRGEGSEGDAMFVADLAKKVGVPSTVVTLAEVLPEVGERRPGNRSALFRAARLALFKRVCRERGLEGVLVAHHADDQAETVLHRLLRGSGVAGVAGMARESVVGGVRVVRPLLGVRRAELRECLVARGQGWREDPSNVSDSYLRNRLRKVLGAQEELVPALLELGEAGRGVREWSEGAAPVLGEAFRVEELNGLPGVLARVAVRRWVVGRGVPAVEVEPAVVERVVRLAGDAAVPGVVNLPGGVRVRRRGGEVAVVQGK